MTGPAGPSPEGPDPLEPLYRLHQGVPRGAPGSDDVTREALARLFRAAGRRAPTSSGGPGVLDLGCGRGRASLVLAAELGAPVLAVDRHPPSLAALEAEARTRGLGPLVETRCADLGDAEAIGVAPGSADLIWSEGSAYVLGLGAALRLWRGWLRRGGCLAVSECSWLGPGRPPAAARFWAEAYPGMGEIGENEARARAAGLEVLDRFTLPERAWWDEYYQPLLERMATLRDGADPGLRAAIRVTEVEIDLRRRHPEAYGYVFYLLRRPERG